MKYDNMTPNVLFRQVECGLTVEQTAWLCFRSIKQVKEWDKGSPIPNECKRLMRMMKGRELSSHCQWRGFSMHYDRLQLPTGQFIAPQQILTGMALIDVQSELELQTSAKLLKYARAIARIKG
ncbi:hypothetical protein [Aeromonas enteropelogenes]